MQILLNIVEVHVIQSNMEIGKAKCELLICARPAKLRAVEELLRDEPGILTFFDYPVNQVKDSYTQISVPQSPRHQSQNAVVNRKIINNNLAFFDDKFGGWSGLVRTTAAQYGLPDPLQYMVNPWQPDRWRSHC